MFKRKVLISIFIIFVSLIIIQVKNPKITGPYKGLLGNIINPILYVYSTVENSIVTLFDNYIFLINTKKENEILKQKIKEYEFEINILKEKLTDYESLKRLLAFQDIYNFKTIACNVIGKKLDGARNYIIVDKGLKDNVSINDTVVSYDGLVGKVEDIYLHSSLIKVILDVTNNVSVMNFRTRATGILKGDGNGGLYIDYYDKLEPVMEGDLFITTGLGKLYKKGIPVGNVIKIEYFEDNLFKKLIIKPSVDFNRIENLLIIKNVEK